mmetsp:Transcript_7362/g.17780  ORF Transcript_7362/g.17780 Transcript_7362/m.17780 type:complete len:602 (+) Transcript_7362:65-1870(+)
MLPHLLGAFMHIAITNFIAFAHVLLALALHKQSTGKRSFFLAVLSACSTCIILWTSTCTAAIITPLSVLMAGFSVAVAVKCLSTAWYFEEVVAAHGASVTSISWAMFLDSFAPGTLVPAVAQKCGHQGRYLVPAPPLRVQCKDAIWTYCTYDLVLGLAVRLSSTAAAAGALGLGPAAAAWGLASRAGLTLMASTAVGLAQLFQFLAFHHILCLVVSAAHSAFYRVLLPYWARLTQDQHYPYNQQRRQEQQLQQQEFRVPSLLLPVVPMSAPWLSASLSELWGKRWHSFFKADFVACGFIPVQHMGLSLLGLQPSSLHHHHHHHHQQDQCNHHHHHRQHQDQHKHYNQHHLDQRQQDQHGGHQQCNHELHQPGAGLPGEGGARGDACGFPRVIKPGPAFASVEAAAAAGQQGPSAATAPPPPPPPPATAAVAETGAKLPFASAGGGTAPPPQPPPALAAGARVSPGLSQARGRACVNALATLSCFLLSGTFHEFMNMASFGTGITKGLQLGFFLLNGVGTIVERALQAWGNKKGLSLPHPVRVVLTLTWLVAIGPLFSIPWIQAGYPAQMLRLVRVDDVLVAAWAFMRWFCMGQGNVVREDL